MKCIHEGKTTECPVIQWRFYGEWSKEEIEAVETLITPYLSQKTPLFEHWPGEWEFDHVGEGTYTAAKSWWTNSIGGKDLEECLVRLQNYMGGGLPV